MEASDIPFVVGEHVRHFPKGFFVRLGRGFLTEYYRTYLDAPDARALTADVDGHAVAFLVGVTNPPAHRQRVLRRHGRALAWRALMALLTHPPLALHFLRTRALRYARGVLRSRRPVQAPGASGVRRRAAVLAHIAVTDSAQGQGIGTALIERFLQQAAAAGRDYVTLVTAAGAEGAGSYYDQHGWQNRGECTTPDGVSLIVYDRGLDPAAAQPTEGEGRVD